MCVCRGRGGGMKEPAAAPVLPCSNGCVQSSLDIAILADVYENPQCENRLVGCWIDSLQEFHKTGVSVRMPW